MRLFKDYTKEPYFFLVNDTTLSSDLGRTYHKMTVSEKIKTINNKIKRNTSQ